VDPNVNFSVISDIKENISSLKYKGLPSYWIAIWNCLDGLHIRNIAPSFEDLIQEVDAMKADPANIMEDGQVLITEGGLEDDIPF
jgi:hypothetical protein